MPAPNRRNKGESLAQHIESGPHAAPRHIEDRRDRLKAQMVRADSKWDEAAARLSPAGRKVAEDARAADEAERVQTEARSTQQNSSAAFRRVLDTACPAHGVSPGESCWWSLAHAAMCNARIRSAGFSGVVASRSLGDKR